MNNNNIETENDENANWGNYEHHNNHNFKELNFLQTPTRSPSSTYNIDLNNLGIKEITNIFTMEKVIKRNRFFFLFYNLYFI